MEKVSNILLIGLGLAAGVIAFSEILPGKSEWGFFGLIGVLVVGGWRLTKPKNSSSTS